jgi:hypothetical protein
LSADPGASGVLVSGEGGVSVRRATDFAFQQDRADACLRLGGRWIRESVLTGGGLKQLIRLPDFWHYDKSGAQCHTWFQNEEFEFCFVQGRSVSG